MEFQPKTREEIERDREAAKAQWALLPDGTYDGVILAAEEKLSKAGKPMFVLEVRVYHPGGEKSITDYVSCEAVGRIFELCEACDLMDEYRSGSLEAHQLANNNVKVRIGKERGGPDGRGGFYPDKNKIKGYGRDTPSRHGEPVSVIPDEEIPF